jgi:hypothetical protein
MARTPTLADKSAGRKAATRPSWQSHCEGWTRCRTPNRDGAVPDRKWLIDNKTQNEKCRKRCKMAQKKCRNGHGPRTTAHGTTTRNGSTKDADKARRQRVATKSCDEVFVWGFIFLLRFTPVWSGLVRVVGLRIAALEDPVLSFLPRPVYLDSV